MLTEERKEYLLAKVNECGFIKNTEAAKELSTSISTIRRDLQELEDEGLIRRIHGGAQSMTTLLQEDSMVEKSSKNMQAKQKIAQYAAQYVQTEDVIFLDAGSTTFAMIPYLKGLHLTVVTNSVMHANALAEQKIPTIILGGLIKENTQAIVTTTAFEQLRQFRFDKCFIGTNSITTFGYATPDIEEAKIKQLAIQNSQQAFVLADETKFKHSSFVKFAELSQAEIITNHCNAQSEKIKSLTTIKEAHQ